MLYNLRTRVSFFFSNSTFLKQSIWLQGILQAQGFPFQQDGFHKIESPGQACPLFFPLFSRLLYNNLSTLEETLKRGHVQSDSAQLPQARISPSALLTKPGLGHADWDWTGMEWIIDWNGENVIKWEREREWEQEIFFLKLRCLLNPHNVNRLLYSKNGEKSQYIEVLTLYDWIHNLKKIIHL